MPVTHCHGSIAHSAAVVMGLPVEFYDNTIPEHAALTRELSLQLIQLRKDENEGSDTLGEQVEDSGGPS